MSLKWDRDFDVRTEQTYPYAYTMYMYIENEHACHFKMICLIIKLVMAIYGNWCDLVIG